MSPSHNEIITSRILSFHPSYNASMSPSLKHSISIDENYKMKNKHDLLKNEILSTAIISKQENEMNIQNPNNRNPNINEIL